MHKLKKKILIKHRLNYGIKKKEAFATMKNNSINTKKVV